MYHILHIISQYILQYKYHFLSKYHGYVCIHSIHIIRYFISKIPEINKYYYFIKLLITFNINISLIILYIKIFIYIKVLFWDNFFCNLLNKFHFLSNFNNKINLLILKCYPPGIIHIKQYLKILIFHYHNN